MKVGMESSFIMMVGFGLLKGFFRWEYEENLKEKVVDLRGFWGRWKI